MLKNFILKYHYVAEMAVVVELITLIVPFIIGSCSIFS